MLSMGEIVRRLPGPQRNQNNHHLPPPRLPTLIPAPPFLATIPPALATITITMRTPQAFTTTDLEKTAAEVKAAGGAILEGPSTTIAGCGGRPAFMTQDPDGWQVVFVEEKKK